MGKGKMKEITRMAIESLAKTDETITPEQVRAGLKALAGEASEPSGSDIINKTPIDRLLSVSDVAEVLGRSPKTVLRYCQAGLLKRCTRRNGIRATGIVESSVRDFVAGKEVA